MDIFIAHCEIDSRDAKACNDICIASTAAFNQLAWTADFLCCLSCDFDNMVTSTIFKTRIHDGNFNFSTSAHFNGCSLESLFHFRYLYFHFFRDQGSCFCKDFNMVTNNIGLLSPLETSDIGCRFLVDSA
ncbi:Uncharacterised protein [Acinetobacter baumannii]|nr:Uncharacterised protein [Acinetobacter baumannii]